MCVCLFISRGNKKCFLDLPACNPNLSIHLSIYLSIYLSNLSIYTAVLKDVQTLFLEKLEVSINNFLLIENESMDGKQGRREES